MTPEERITELERAIVLLIEKIESLEEDIKDLQELPAEEFPRSVR